MNTEDKSLLAIEKPIASMRVASTIDQEKHTLEYFNPTKNEWIKLGIPEGYKGEELDGLMVFGSFDAAENWAKENPVYLDVVYTQLPAKKKEINQQNFMNFLVKGFPSIGSLPEEVKADVYKLAMEFYNLK